MCLQRHFRKSENVQKVFDFVMHLSQTPRFGIIRLFLTKADKDNFKALANFLEQNSHPLPEEIKNAYL